jgi:hypothetical protein
MLVTIAGAAIAAAATVLVATEFLVAANPEGFKWSRCWPTTTPLA